MVEINIDPESAFILDSIDKKLMDLIQNNFPVSKKPFDEIAKTIGIKENETIFRIRNLFEKKYIKFMGAVIETKAMGFKSMLVAFKVQENQISNSVKFINSYPGVSHNYQRDAEFNIWFTIAVPQDMDLNKTIKKIAELSNAEKYLEFPSLKIFKIGLKLTVENFKKMLFEKKEINLIQQKNSYEFNETETKIINSIQYSLPVVNEPFHKIALATGIKEEVIIETINKFLDKGVIKRFGAILAHQKIGYRYNTLALWEVPDDKIDSYGKFISSFQNVSHCYSRTTYPDWNYSLYSMIHTHNEVEMQEIINKIISKTGKINFLLLKSIKEFKKQRLAYFTDEYKNWHEKYQV